MRPRANGAFKPMRGEATSRGAISANRRTWLRLDKLTVIMYRYHGTFLGRLPEGSSQAAEYGPLIDEHGDDIVLHFDGKYGNIRVNLSEFTSDELQAFRDFIDRAVVRADPIVRARDRIAQEVLDEYGDDSNTRIYRALPELIVRKGEGVEYDKGLRLGPDEPTPVGEGRFRITPIAGVFDRQMAQRDSRGSGSEDDRTPTDQREGVLEVGGDGEQLPF